MGVRLVLYSLAISTVLSAIATGIQLYSSYSRQTQSAIEAVELVENTFRPSLETALWKFDQEQAKILLDGLLANTAISGLALVTETGLHVDLGEPAETAYSHNIPLVHLSGSGADVPVGNLRVHVSLDAVQNRIIADFWTLIASNLLKAYVGAICLLLLFHYLVARHLQRIAVYLDESDPDDETLTLSLHRKTRLIPDQLDKITQAFNFAQLRVFDSVTALKSEIETRKQAEQAAHDAMEVRNTFLATMSHEVRTPLNAIMGFLQLIERRAENDKQRQMAQAGIQAANRLLDQLVNVLEVSRLEAKMVEIREQPTDLREQAGNWLTEIDAQMSRYGKALDTELIIADSLPDMVLLDPVRVAQIVTNLTDNAAKFTETGRITLRLSRDPARPALWIDVEDTGPGLGDGDHAQLFDRFVQAESGPKRRKDGSGLGLSICQDLARLMGGDVTARDRRSAQGAVFRITLPLMEADAPEAVH